MRLEEEVSLPGGVDSDRLLRHTLSVSDWMRCKQEARVKMCGCLTVQLSVWVGEFAA